MAGTVDDSGILAPTQPKTSQIMNKVACVACRAVKMKCRPSTGETSACERCSRKTLHCVFRQQKRGRKPAARSLVNGQAIMGSARTVPQITSDNTGISTDNISCLRAHATGDSGSSSSKELRENKAQSGTWAQSKGLQPPNLLNHEAMKGWFPEGAFTTRIGTYDNNTETLSAFCDGDPIHKGLVSYHVAASMFQGFMKSLNPLVCVLDPVLCTFQHVRQRSSFLLAVILAAAAKAFNPPSHPALRNCAEGLFLESFRRGTKSVETIQAILLFTYWKQADDTRSWASVGYAIRLAMELGWHKLSSRSASNIEQSEQQIRARRSVERTWLVLFIHDRGASLQMGKPWMIEKSEFIESVNAWQKDQYATSNDATLCAMATLRLTTADIIEVLNPQRPSPPLSSPDRINPLLRMLKPQLDSWLKHWTNAVGEEPCHKFLVNFYVHHVQLFLYSFPLQESLAVPAGGPLIDNNAFWIAYTSALEMLKSIAHPTMSPLLSFIHDAVHIMIAYAAVFLVKLLLSVHLGIRQEIEVPIIQNITLTAQVLAAQEMPSTYSCSMQARFLRNLIRDYEKTCQGTVQREQNQPTAQPKVVSPQRQAETPVSSYPVISSDSQPTLHTAGVCDATSTTTPLNNICTHERLLQRRSHDPNFGRGPQSYNSQESGGIGAIEAPASNWILNHDESWTTMLMNAGFDVEEGVFLPVQSAVG